MASPEPPSKKRRSPDTAPAPSSQQATKKRKLHRKLQHLQPRPLHIEPAPQDPVFIQGQLLRSISAALTLAGFDSAKPSALESFRAAVEEYMLEFLGSVRMSMRSNRRFVPTAQDFCLALAGEAKTECASLLRPQLGLDLPQAISHPEIEEPTDPPPSPPHDFSKLLEPLISKTTPVYIPKHFPKLPPQHAWRSTAVYPAREQDARKMRERATEEGILAEQALRRLAAAAKSGAVKAERRRRGEGEVLSGPGKKMDGRGVKGRVGGGEDMYSDMLRDVVGAGGGEDEIDLGLSLDGAGDVDVRKMSEGVDLGMPEGVLVNSDMGAWRKGGRRGLRL